jgi:hypothetical protein
MPYKIFFENYHLYENCDIDTPFHTTNIPCPPINLFCKECDSVQTFEFEYKTDRYNNTVRGFRDNSNQLSKQAREVPIDSPTIKSPSSEITNITYLCAGCKKTKQFYSIRIDHDIKKIMKIGQFPQWDISIDKNLKKIMKNHEELYKKGLICESQSYGIGAFAYYRRIVEVIIDEILVKILEVVTEENKKDYMNVLEQAKQSHRADQKINIVKDEIPTLLMIEGTNPLKSLYKHLSIGIHSLSDEECLKKAKSIKNILIFIITILVNTGLSSCLVL